MNDKDLYKDSRKAAIIFQVASGLLLFGIRGAPSLMLIWWYCMIGFWAGYMLIKYRRRGAPTKIDILWIKWSFIPLYLLGMFISVYIWRLRGVRDFF